MIITRLFFERAIKKLTKCRLKTIMVMNEKNFIYSEAAHMSTIKNPLVNVAVYGASRQIQTRGLKVDASINHFLMNQKDAIIRTQRNIIILKAAYTAGKSLKKSYKETLKLLTKYNKTKDNSLLASNKIEPINLDDAEEYFKAKNWAHPLLDADKYITHIDNTMPTPVPKKYHKALKIYEKALKMKNDAIKEAKESETKYHDKMNKLLEYNKLLKEAKEIGRVDKDFDKALKLMNQATKLVPDDPEALWGLATALHHAGKIKESIAKYKELIEKFPDNVTFKFEYGQVLLRHNELQEGLKIIGEVMEVTDEFDNFLTRIGDIYLKGDLVKEALVAYNSYLEKFPFDFEAWNKKGQCLDKLGKKALAQKAYNKALEIKPK